MEKLIVSLIKPDNIALVIMCVFTIVTVFVALREIIANDRLIKNGEKDKIYERMT